MARAPRPAHDVTPPRASRFDAVRDRLAGGAAKRLAQAEARPAEGFPAGAARPVGRCGRPGEVVGVVVPGGIGAARVLGVDALEPLPAKAGYDRFA